MNFFGHFLVDRIEDKPWYTLGLVYPDLYRDFFKKGIPDLDYLRNSNDHFIHDFIMGIDKHIVRDAHFHSSAFFKASQIEIKKLFEQVGVLKVLPRYWFGIHVFMEIYLDRQEVSKNKNLVNLFYQHLNEVLDFSTQNDLLYQNSNNHTQFLKRLERIVKDKFIFAYSNNEMFLKAFWGIYYRAGIMIDENIKEVVSEQLQKVLNQLETSEPMLYQDDKIIK